MFMQAQFHSMYIEFIKYIGMKYSKLIIYIYIYKICKLFVMKELLSTKTLVHITIFHKARVVEKSSCQCSQGERICECFI